MIVFAYFYSEPLLEYDLNISGDKFEIDRIYHDLGARYELEKLLNDCSQDPPNYLLIRQVEELGDSWEIIKINYQILTKLGIKIISFNLDNCHDAELFENVITINVNDSNISEKIKKNQQKLSLQKAQSLTRIKALPPPG